MAAFNLKLNAGKRLFAQWSYVWFAAVELREVTPIICVFPFSETSATLAVSVIHILCFYTFHLDLAMSNADSDHIFSGVMTRVKNPIRVRCYGHDQPPGQEAAKSETSGLTKMAPSVVGIGYKAYIIDRTATCFI